MSLSDPTSDEVSCKLQAHVQVGPPETRSLTKKSRSPHLAPLLTAGAGLHEVARQIARGRSRMAAAVTTDGSSPHGAFGVGAARYGGQCRARGWSGRWTDAVRGEGRDSREAATEAELDGYVTPSHKSPWAEIWSVRLHDLTRERPSEVRRSCVLSPVGFLIGLEKG